MDRRAYLGSLTVGLGGLAGCSGRGPSSGGTPTPTPAQTRPPPSSEVDLPLPDEALYQALPKDAIPAITEPAFGTDWEAVDSVSLRPDDEVIGIERNGEARAYPLRVLDFHEVVNDEFDGPLLVTFCPLCGSGVTAERRVDGQETTFGVSGFLWRSDLVMYDALTGSLWSQLLGQAVQGPKTGERLSFVPSQRTRWRNWKRSYAETSVLLPPPESDTVTGDAGRYGSRGYAGYDESSRIGVGQNDFADHRLHPKTLVIGVENGGEAIAYPLPAVNAAGVVNDRVGDRPVVVAAMPGGSLTAYWRTVDETLFEFERADEFHLFAGGSTWKIQTGRAVDGPHEGSELTVANDVSPEFWFAWAQFHPETTVYEG